MKNLLFVILLFATFTTQAAITIISDLDDTIKITEASGDPGDLLGEKIYTGMPEFYQGSKGYSKTLYVLSASPSLLRSKVEGILRKNKISYQGLLLRSNIFENKFDYKVRAIKRLIDSSSDDFILIGDDVGDDPEVYAEINRLYPGRILDSYVHVVRARRIPKGIISYWTSFDLTLREFESSRMKESWVKKVFKKLLGERDLEYVFPREAHCPSVATVWQWQTRTIFSREAGALVDRFNSFCQVRQSANYLIQ
ncbi:MAG: phosphatase domain-containing protein [Bacteriovoracia bacterium]